MAKLPQSAIVGLAFTMVAAAAPASAGGYLEGPSQYGYFPGLDLIGAPDGSTIAYSYSEVRIRSRGAPSYHYGYGPVYLPGKPAYETVVIRATRIIADPALKFCAPKRQTYFSQAYSHGLVYGSIKDIGPARENPRASVSSRGQVRQSTILGWRSLR